MKSIYASLILLLFVAILSLVPTDLWAAAATPEVVPDETAYEMIGGFLMDWGVPAAIIVPLTTIILWALGLVRFRKTDAKS